MTSIGNVAFQSCIVLNNVTLPSSVTTFGSGIFDNCSGLSIFNITSGVTTIGVSMFNNCPSLTNIEIPNSVTTISNTAFQGSGLTNVTIPSMVTTLGTSAFFGCTYLTTVVFKNPTIYTTCGTNCFNAISSSAMGTFENVNPADASGLGTGTPASTLPAYFATDIYLINCILKGTPILTSDKYVKIEELCVDDTVITWDNRAVKIISTHVQDVIADTCEFIPYKIPKGVLGALDDLYISKHHCILIDGEYFNVPHNMPQLSQSEIHIGQSITYYHIETDNYFTDTLVANGVPIETFTRLSFNQIKQQAEFIVVKHLEK